ncbi:MAG: hypothetical protein JOZ17_16455, partial [Acetobacteraceae bacterium]|nr:hypothetical protein [Acetobacteraceae bacterium]
MLAASGAAFSISTGGAATGTALAVIAGTGFSSKADGFVAETGCATFTSAKGGALVLELVGLGAALACTVVLRDGLVTARWACAGFAVLCDEAAGRVLAPAGCFTGTLEAVFAEEEAAVFFAGGFEEEDFTARPGDAAPRLDAADAADAFMLDT